MNANITIKSLFLSLGILSFLVTSKASAEEWIDVDVVVNVVDGANAGNIDDAIKKANEAMKKAKVRLVKKATDPSATADSDGSGDLDRDERDKARENGQKALEKAAGAGKGIKIDVANNCDADDAGAVGISIHRNPVMIVEPEADANELGKTIAHELCHIFTLDYDLYGPGNINRLMYAYSGSGTDLGVEEVNEVRKGARVRGRPYFIAPRVLPGSAVAIPAGIDYSVGWFGAVLDDFGDVSFIDPYNSITGPNDPTIRYADFGEVIEPDNLFTPGTHIDYYIETTIQLRGQSHPWSIESFFDINYQAETGPPIGRAHIELQNWTPVSATWFNNIGLPTADEVVVHVDTESEFHGMPHYGEPHNMTLRVEVPSVLILNPASGAATSGKFKVMVQSYHYDHRYAPDPTVIQLMDQTVPFTVSLGQPCPCPSLSFALNKSSGILDPKGNVNISGCGFAPNTPGHLCVETDSRVIVDRATTTSADGKLSEAIGCSTLNPVEGWVRVTFQPEYYGPLEAAPDGATGYFIYCPDGEISGDLNSDCVVNLYDMAILADNWLKGTEP